MAEEAGFIRVLLVGEYDPDDRALVRRVCRLHKWKLLRAARRRQAIWTLRHSEVHVVIADPTTAVWNFREALMDLRHLHPVPALIVASGCADGRLWAEVLSVGGHDVLSRPFDADEVRRAVVSAHYRHGSVRFQPVSETDGISRLPHVQSI